MNPGGKDNVYCWKDKWRTNLRAEALLVMEN